jgi:hypothetical protein
MRPTMNVVPFRPAESFERHGIDWTKPPSTEHERVLREAFLTHESSCGPKGLASLILLALVVRRQGSVAGDLAYAADLAEIMLSMTLRTHQDDALALAYLRSPHVS